MQEALGDGGRWVTAVEAGWMKKYSNEMLCLCGTVLMMSLLRSSFGARSIEFTLKTNQQETMQTCFAARQR